MKIYLGPYIHCREDSSTADVWYRAALDHKHNYQQMSDEDGNVIKYYASVWKFDGVDYSHSYGRGAVGLQTLEDAMSDLDKCLISVSEDGCEFLSAEQFVKLSILA